MPNPPHIDAARDIETLERFFLQVDADTLFDSRNESHCENLRYELSAALFRLLVWNRPHLERQRGLLWPYRELQKRSAFFTDRFREHPRPAIRHQALAFLCRLPFPGQWRWLNHAESQAGSLPEVKALFETQKTIVQEKVARKRQKTYKLRHFCQILKRPDPPGEKGILRIFSLPYLFADQTLLQALCREYLLFVEPAAGIVYRHGYFRAFSGIKSPSLFGAAGPEDAEFLESQPGILTTPLAHADFLEDDTTVDLCAEKRFDVIFNGTYDEMPRKRHEKMLALLRHPRLDAATALFLGRGKDPHVDAFKEMVKRWGLSHRVTVLANVPRREIPVHLSRCRVGVHLALHENGCRCIYEFFRSDLPCVVSSCTAGVNFDIFNHRTGLVAPDGDLAEAIGHLLDHPGRFAPRDWFLAHSGSANASGRLNRRFKEIFSDLGQKWTTDIVALGSSGASRYVSESDYEKFRPDFKRLFELLTRTHRFPVPLVLE